MGQSRTVTEDVKARFEWAARDVVKGAVAFSKGEFVMAEAWTRNALDLLHKAVEGILEVRACFADTLEERPVGYESGE